MAALKYRDRLDKLTAVEFVIEHAAVSGAKTARKGLFRNHKDILGLLEPEIGSKGDVRERVMVLAMVTRPAQQSLLLSEGRTVRFVAIRLSSNSAVASAGSNAQSLLAFPLVDDFSQTSTSIQDLSTVEAPKFLFNFAKSSLRQATNNSLTTYDLSTIWAKQLSKIPISTGKSPTILQISPTLVAVSLTNSIDVYDTTYGSTQATAPTRDTSLLAPDSVASRKRKYTELTKDNSIAQAELVSFFPDQGLIAAIHQGNLVAYNVTSASLPFMESGRDQDGLLINSIHRGVKSERNHNWSKVISQAPNKLGSSLYTPTEVDAKHMEEVFTKMDRYAERNDVENFEKVFAAEVEVSRDERKLWEWRKKRDQWEKVNGLTNGAPKSPKPNGIKLLNGASREQSEIPGTPMSDKASSSFPEDRPLPEWNWDNISVNSHGSKLFPMVTHQLVLHALSRMFSYEQPVPHTNGFTNGEVEVESPRLRLDLYAPNIIRWMVESGSLSISNIETSIRSRIPSFQKLATGEIVNALLDFDREMNLLVYIFQSGTFLEASEVLYAVKVIMRSLGFGSSTIPLNHLLKYDSEAPDGDSAAALKHDLHAAEQDLALALSVLEAPAIREEALRVTLTRLYAFPPTAITKEMKRNLSRPELMSLVHLLRSELANGGWTSSILAPLPTDEDGEGEGTVLDHGIGLISSLLSCAIESAGVGGWIFNGDSSDDPSGTNLLISDLQEEVTVALSGIQEAAYLKGLLGSVIQFSETLASPSAKSVNAQLQSAKAKTEPKLGQIVIAQPSTTEASLLPLGLGKKTDELTKQKIDLSGRVKVRSDRELKAAARRNVPKYSFEKIVL
jgi:hypothetical protein